MHSSVELHVWLLHQERFAALRLATEPLEDARAAGNRAIVEAHQSGLSVRQIGGIAGLSSSRVHQLLGADETRDGGEAAKAVEQAWERGARLALVGLPPSQWIRVSSVPI